MKIRIISLLVIIVVLFSLVDSRRRKRKYRKAVPANPSDCPPPQSGYTYAGLEGKKCPKACPYRSCVKKGEICCYYN